VGIVESFSVFLDEELEGLLCGENILDFVNEIGSDVVLD